MSVQMVFELENQQGSQAIVHALAACRKKLLDTDSRGKTRIFMVFLIEIRENLCESVSSKKESRLLRQPARTKKVKSLEIETHPLPRRA